VAAVGRSVLLDGHVHRRGRWALRGSVYSSRWTVSGEKAGRQTATYSAPSGPGVL
jgi:hypothetical protein